MGDDSNIIKIGPLGSKAGTPWDEKYHSVIVQIFISHDNEINSIQFQYVENGSLVLSETHGASNGYNFDVVKFKFPTEYVTSISGHKSYTNNHVCSITFGTNQAEYGPFGNFTAHDKEFNFRLGQDRQFAGFHGTADNNGVKSIGIYLKPNTALDYFVNKSVVKLNKESESWEVLDEIND